MRSLSLFVIIVLLSVVCGTVNAEAKESAKIIYVKGRVLVQHLGDVSWLPAKKGMMLKKNDTVKTAVRSEVDIALDSSMKNIVKLRPDTEVVLEELKAHQDAIVLDHMDSDTSNVVLDQKNANEFHMSRGKVLAMIEALPSGSSFEVHTPTAVAGVAGSGMSVATNGKTTSVGCFSDKIFIVGINIDGTLMEKIVIREGYKSMVDQYKQPTKPIGLTAAEQKEWDQFEEHVKRHVQMISKSVSDTSQVRSDASAGYAEGEIDSGISEDISALEKIQGRLKKDLERVDNMHDNKE